MSNSYISIILLSWILSIDESSNIFLSILGFCGAASICKKRLDHRGHGKRLDHRGYGKRLDHRGHGGHREN